MSVLIDTNVLLRSVQPAHPMHSVSVRAIQVLLAADESVFITIQNVAEFWNAATRPLAHNGMGFGIERATEEIARLESFSMS